MDTTTDSCIFLIHHQHLALKLQISAGYCIYYFKSLIVPKPPTLVYILSLQKMILDPDCFNPRNESRSPGKDTGFVLCFASNRSKANYTMHFPFFSSNLANQWST